MRFRLYFITLISILIIFISSTVYADGSFSVDMLEMNNGLITVRGTAKNPKTPVSVAIFRKSTGTVFYVNEVRSDENGFFEISLRLPESLNGEDASGAFKVVASSEFSIDDNKTFEYVSESARQTFFKSLTAENIKQEISKADNAIIFETLGVDIDSYETKLTSNQQNSALEFFLKNTSWNDVTINNLASKLNCGIYAVMIQSGKTSEALDELDILYDGVKYSQISNSEHKKFILDNMDKVNYSTEEEINSQYAWYYSVYLLSNAKTSEYISLLQKHKDSLILNNSSVYNSISSLSGEDATKAGRKIAQLMEKEAGVNSKEELDSLLDDVYDYMYDNSNSSSGSGGGGGSKKGGTIIGLPVTNIPIVNSTAENKTFSDIGDVLWANDAINEMAQKNIINGTGDGRFLPNNQVKREEFVKMLVLSLGVYNAGSRCSFDDVSEDNWAYTYVASAVNSGYVKGIDDKNFGFGAYVTRQDAAVLIARALNLGKVSQTVTFEDDGEISDYAKDAVYAMCEKGIVNGVGENRFAPKAVCTRAMAAKMIYSAILSGGAK